MVVIREFLFFFLWDTSCKNKMMFLAYMARDDPKEKVTKVLVMDDRKTYV